MGVFRGLPPASCSSHVVKDVLLEVIYCLIFSFLFIPMFLICYKPFLARLAMYGDVLFIDGSKKGHIRGWKYMPVTILDHNRLVVSFIAATHSRCVIRCARRRTLTLLIS